MFMPPRPLEGRHTSIRNQKKKTSVTEGKEREEKEKEEEESEDDEIKEVVRKMPWHSLAYTTFYHPTVEKLGHGAMEHDGLGPLSSDFQRNLTIAEERNPVVPLASSAKNNNKNRYKFASVPAAVREERRFTLTRPQTAPERPRSPIVNNMPSQLHEQAMTGSTNNDLYPKWFRASNSYSRPGSRPSTFYMNLQNRWNRTEAQRRFHEQFPENAPDIRQKPDLRITTNERRHMIPETGLHGYYLH